ncbi:DUF3820 family protein [uncultured Polaribacter sp.]|uniref:DUF3820 family protein n=1 Tax=uncultured Polaribacter sp. TaxID=174711 RepID=UPI0026038DB3|nr:DUF3820 family protein [uncultured Polaribacter sp.]
MEMNNLQNQQFLIDLAKMKMPFGKYKGRFLIDLPEYYIVWYKTKGFPNGKLGKQMELVYELQLNGLEDVIRKIKRDFT